jgi:serine/threonine-protein kinase
MCPDGEIAVIDIAMFYTDPWNEFSDMPHNANEQAHFYTGQINGYFKDEPPPYEYFQLLSFYIAINALDNARNPENDGNPERAEITIGWFDDMRNPVPTWYLSDYITA